MVDKTYCELRRRLRLLGFCNETTPPEILELLHNCY